MHNIRMKTVGYARVSTTGQSLAAQLDQLAAAACDRVFQETMSGARADRPELRKAVATLEAGDVFLISRLDRLARSTRDLLDIVAAIEGKGAQLRSLAEAWADTTTPAGRLMLTILGGLAEFERSLIRERTGEGRARAKQAGRSLGRKPKLTPHQRQEVLARRATGESTREIARSYNVNASTISRLQ